jgi:1,4-alpha-glucan branching enzyme
LPTDLGLGRVIYTENHDETGRLNGKRRLLADADEDDPQSLTARRKHALAAVLTLTAPGVPLIFMGQELREDREFHDSNPLDWDRGAVSDGSTKLFRDLIRLRRNLDGQSAALRGTKIRILAEDRDKQFLAYRRYQPGQPQDDIVVLVNFSPEPIEKMPFVFPRPARWKLLVNTDDPTYGENFTGVAAEWRGAESNVRPVNLAPFSAQIFGIAKERLP